MMCGEIGLVAHILFEDERILFNILEHKLYCTCKAVVLVSKISLRAGTE